MKIKSIAQSAVAALLLSALDSELSIAFAQGTAFTYQGRLNESGAPANGSYDLTFTLFTNNTGGVAIAGPITNTAAAVSNGLFATTIDFGPGVFTGGFNWLEIAVQTNGGGDFTTLTPRQQLTPTPYAIFAGGTSNLLGNLPAGQLSGSLSSANLSGIYGSAVTFSNSGNSFAGDGSSLANLNANNLVGGTVPAAALNNAWKTTGNSNTVSGVNFLGTTDNRPLELHANGLRALRLEQPANDATHSNAVNVIGGSPVNVVSNGVFGATISGGGAAKFLSFTLLPNEVDSDFGTIGGGLGNTAGDTATTIGGGLFNTGAGRYSTVAGGEVNFSGGVNATVGGGFGNSSTGYSATIGGGYYNVGSGDYATVAGGNQGTASGREATLVGGEHNSALGDNSSVGGGYDNTASGVSAAIAGGSYNTNGAYYSSIGGGYQNTIGPNALNSTISGGQINTISAPNSTIAGGEYNSTGTNTYFATISGGGYHTIGTNSSSTTISGGYNNSIGDNTLDTAIGGGSYNIVATNSSYSTIAGGQANSIYATAGAIGGGIGNISRGSYAVVPGGYGNIAAGDNSFAAGTLAQANHSGTFVWSDASDFLGFASTVPNQFSVRALGGVRLVTGGTGMTLDGQAVVTTNAALRSGGNTFTGQQTFTGGNVGIGTVSPVAALHVRGPDAAQFTLQNSGDNSSWYFADDVNDNLVFQPNTGSGAYIDRAGNYHNNSDVRLKQDITPLNEVLVRVLQLRPVSYHFRNAPEGTPVTLGLIAQEVQPLFPEVVGERSDIKSLAYTELVPVTIRAIQELNQKVEDQKRELNQKQTEITDLKQRLEALEKIVLNQK